MQKLLLAACVGLLCVTSRARADSDLKWSGFTWSVRNDTGDPGNNQWSDKNVTVDAKGLLHIRIAQIDGHWACSELYTQKSLGFGEYQFLVTGPIDSLDKNVVLGLFSYPEPDVGPDGTNEIDIEFARWGSTDNPIGNYTAWPLHPQQKTASDVFDFHLHSPDTTQRYTWKPGSITFQTLQGHTDNNDHEIHNWTTPRTFANRVGKKPMPLHINLWLFDGKPPSDGKPVEIILKAFKFTPTP